MDEMKVGIHGYVRESLRDLVVAEADAQGIPVSECVAMLLAKALDRPELGTVPRKQMGRPRKDKPVNSKARKKGKTDGK